MIRSFLLAVLLSQSNQQQSQYFASKILEQVSQGLIASNNIQTIAAIATGNGVQVSSICNWPDGAHGVRLDYGQSNWRCVWARGNPEQPYENSWAAGNLDLNQYIQIGFTQPRVVHRIRTQGKNEGQQWVTYYKVSYSLNGIDWINYDNGREIKGNVDQRTIVTQDLNPFIARAIRIQPTQWYSFIGMRAEVYYYDYLY
ncbi:hypothetical protein FGO68_gene6117 [Halteria grandinella]|uniref:F5/8 type C domain-containing protein n=1 Tax=Halteria grandinella TaxID=5974 RepID=A0A8J8T1U7_HALGN|nr:hypothetical protein FGO68_gene6117 [Halteria grandinella]